ncbi:hypothetical protein D9M69_303650 [compost metagenome]
MLSTGSATEAIRVTSSVVISTWPSRVVVWLDSPSTLKARWSAKGWSLTVRVKRISMRLPSRPGLTWLAKVKISALPGPTLTDIGPSGLVLPVPRRQIASSSSGSKMPRSNSGSGR